MLKTNKCANGIVNALEIAKENWRWFHSYKMLLAKYKKIEFEQITSLGETMTTKTTHPLDLKKRVAKATSYGILFYCKTLQGFFFLCLQKHLLAWKMLSPIDANFHHLHAKPSTIQIRNLSILCCGKAYFYFPSF
jgi:hypothetical protein